MKKFLPFAFPAAALLVVLILAVTWFNSKRMPAGEVSSSNTFAEGVQIENLSQAEQSQVMLGSTNIETVMLEATENADSDMMAQVRYEIVEDENGNKVRFSVMAGMPDLESGMYQVWLKDAQSDAVRKAFPLEFSKGGYLGSAAISADVLPFEVLISAEQVDDEKLETVLFRGIVSEMQ